MKHKIQLLAGALLWLANLHAQNIAINETNFPDAEFRKYLLTNYDQIKGYGADGVFTPEEIADITYMNINVWYDIPICKVLSFSQN